MHHINNRKTLADAIRNLEAQRDLELEILKKYTDHTLQELNPISILKDKFQEGLSDVTESLQSSGFKGSILKAGISLVSGLLTKQFISGTNAGFFTKLAGAVFQSVVSGFLMKKIPDDNN